jgi:hypothetical protein
MAFVGMLAMGIFVGGVVTLGLRKAATTIGDFLKMMTGVLTAAFGGVVVTFMDRFRPGGPSTGAIDSRSFFMYPVGLLIALLWLYFEDVWTWGQPHPGLRWIGPAFIVLITILAAALALLPGFRAALG